MRKKQNNKSCYCKKHETNPVKIAVYESERGKIFTAKPSMHAENRIIPKKAWVDERGLVCIEI